jgi:hypothetical protein
MEEYCIDQEQILVSGGDYLAQDMRAKFREYCQSKAPMEMSIYYDEPDQGWPDQDWPEQGGLRAGYQEELEVHFTGEKARLQPP